MISKPPGVEDIFPDRIDRWNFVLNSAIDTFRRYNYRELIVPVMEFTEVFARGIGTDTDIVSKEMFTFEDRGGRSLTLRPEGTAGVVRAYAENGEYNRLSVCKFFYNGPMFRAEKPQKGRLRQFNQFGAEIFGSDDPYYDYEIISVVDEISKAVGIDSYTILINSIGCRECRGSYMEKLREYYRSKEDKLCPDCKRRLETNPLRLLDCKNESCAALKSSAPVIKDHLCRECSDHFMKVKQYLDISEVQYTEDPYLVRGLDYYTKTTFEFVTDKLGGQNAFAGGGRYDYLVEQFGGKPTPGVGFAAGMERINLIIEENPIPEKGTDLFMIHTGGDTFLKSLEILHELRKNGLSVDIDPGVKGFKAQFKRADREKATFVAIIGEDELASGSASVKNQKTGEQEKVPFDNIYNFLTK
ncbi:MAG TPA: histidine--tRNA ligase [Spirochaetota bacterium]|nr:histidine--tRNA ligase [Spirochaetota bacterium]HPJ34979.1 histidine--tRNA ligase [Spirochaetota bacterium]